MDLLGFAEQHKRSSQLWQWGLAITLACAIIVNTPHIVAAFWLNVGNASFTHDTFGTCLRAEQDLFELPFRSNCETIPRGEFGYRRALEIDVGGRRPYRGLALLYWLADNIEEAAETLERYTSVNIEDRSAHLILANMYHVLDRPQEALSAYQTLRPFFRDQGGSGMRANNRALERRILVEHIRAGYQLLTIGDLTKAKRHIRIAEMTDPTNVVVLYEQARLDQQHNVSRSKALSALSGCHFELPPVRDVSLIAYLPEIAGELVRSGTWTAETATAISSFVEWAHRENKLSVRRDGEKTSDKNLIDNPGLLPEPVNLQPEYWRWRIWDDDNDDRLRSGVYFGGVERFENTGLNALRISAVCIEPAPSKSMPNAGFHPPSDVLKPGISYRLSFVYRADPATVGTPKVYLAWNEGSPEQVRTTVDLTLTEGEWRQFERIFTSPFPSKAELAILLLLEGEGTVWFSDISLQEIGS